MLVRLTALLLSLAFLTCCATPIGTLMPQSSIPGDVSYASGHVILTSAAPNSIVMLMPVADTVARGSHACFILSVANISRGPMTLTPDAVRVTTDKGKILRVLTAADLAAEANRKIAWKRFAVALAMASNNMAASGAGYSNQIGSYAGGYQANNAYGMPAGAGTYSGTFAASGYNGAAAADANLKANALKLQMAQVERAQEAQISQSAQIGAFESQTIPAGYVYPTPLTLDRLPNGPTTVAFSVTIGTDAHVQHWSYERR